MLEQRPELAGLQASRRLLPEDLAKSVSEPRLRRPWRARLHCYLLRQLRRFCHLYQHLQPVSPGPLSGTSKHTAVEQAEAVAASAARIDGPDCLGSVA